jgi:hypothetical protein
MKSSIIIYKIGQIICYNFPNWISVWSPELVCITQKKNTKTKWLFLMLNINNMNNDKEEKKGRHNKNKQKRLA